MRQTIHFRRLEAQNDYEICITRGSMLIVRTLSQGFIASSSGAEVLSRLIFEIEDMQEALDNAKTHPLYADSAPGG